MTILYFLNQLKENNHKDWFDHNRKMYEVAKAELVHFLENLIVEIQKFDPSIGDPDALKCMFRINRDVRFSKDKSPYKTYMSGFIARGGNSFPGAGYYVHFEPGKSFAGGGIYSPQPEIQQAIRNEIYFNALEFQSIIDHPSFVKMFGSIMNEKYSRIPKGYPVDFDYGDLLKYKHYVASAEIPSEMNDLADIQDFTVKAFHELYPLNQFLNHALTNR